MATTSELSIKISVDSGQLKILSSQLNEVSKQSKSAASAGSSSFDQLKRQAEKLSQSIRSITGVVTILTDTSKKQAEELKKAEKELIQFLKEREKTIEEFNQIKFDFLPEPEQIKAKRDELLNTVEKLVQQVPALTQEAQALREQIIVDSERKITEILKQEEQERRQAEIQRLQESDSLLENFKGGFLDFVESIRSNSQTIADFWANTLSQMSSAFSDFLFNAITGKFNSLVDVAKAAFQSILRAFLDMVSAIVTRQIVVSIGGLFGLGGSQGQAGAGGGGGLFSTVGGLLGKGIGAIGSFLGLGGAGAAIAAPGLAAGVPDALFGISGVIGALPAAGALGILGPIGATIGAAAVIIPTLIAGIGALLDLFNAPPRGDITVGFVDKAKTQFATVAQILEAAGDLQSDFAKLVFRGGFRGANVPGGFDAVRKVLAEQATQVIESIQQIIGTLPTQLSRNLNTLLLETQVEVRARLNEFHFKGKTVNDALKKFLEGEFQAEFIFSLNSFFSVALAGLGVNVEAAEKFVSGKLAEFEALQSREARAAFGQEFLTQFQLFVDAFNFLNDNLGDSINVAINQMNSLATQLGFEGIPTIDELKVKLQELFNAAELDPDTIGKFIQLRNAIVQMGVAITGAITNIAGFIDELNTKIAQLGGTTIDTSGAIRESIAATQQILSQSGLSLEEREALLRQMSGAVDQLLAQGVQDITAQQLQAEAELEAQRALFESRISGLEAEKSVIQDAARARIDALQEELRVIQELTDLAESIRQNIQSLLLGSSSILTPTQRLALAQSQINTLFGQLGSATDSQRAGVGKQIQDLLNQVVGIGGEAFQQPSLEFRDTFRNVIEQLEDLQAMVEPTRSIEEINTEIGAVNKRMEAQLAGIDAQIEALRQQSSSLQAQQIQVSNKYADEARVFYEYIRGEAVKILEARLQQLRDLGIGNLESLGTMEAIGVSQLTVLREIRDAVQVNNAIQASTASTITGGISSANPRTTNPLGGGFEGTLRRPTVFLAHTNEDVSIRPKGKGGRSIVMNFHLYGTSRENAQEFIRLIKSNLEVRRALGIN